jgi:hypothetical protein
MTTILKTPAMIARDLNLRRMALLRSEQRRGYPMRDEREERYRIDIELAYLLDEMCKGEMEVAPDSGAPQVGFFGL